jgi:cyclophilin family peptidyl-prolyl cis-trans isomerase
VAYPSPKFLITTFLLFITSLLFIGCNQVNSFGVEILVKDETGAPVPQAPVRAEMGVRDFSEAVTDSNGIARLAIDQAYAERWAKVIVEASGYPKQSFLVKLLKDAPPAPVQLKPEGATPVAQQPANTPEPSPTVQPVEPIQNDASAVENANGSPGPLANVPPAQRSNYYTAKPERSIEPGQSYRAIIKTGKGDIVLSLDAAAAPEHVNNFIFLSRQGFYNGLTFHRVEPGFVIQGGDPEGSGQGGPGYTIPGEFDLKHSEGALAMARLPDQINPNRESSGSQFYITLAPTPFLDGQYSVFGQVEAGMDVVRSIEIGDVIEQIIIEPQ